MEVSETILKLYLILNVQDWRQNSLARREVPLSVIIPAIEFCSPGLTTTRAPTLCWVICNRETERFNQSSQDIQKSANADAYRLDSIVDRVIGGAPKPGSVRALPFGSQDIGDLGALEAMLLNAGCRGGLVAREHERTHCWRYDTHVLQDSALEHAPVWEDCFNSSLHFASGT